MLHELRIKEDKSGVKEAAFEVDKEEKKHEDQPDFSSYEEEAKFLQNIMRGTKKFKGKLPFNFFECGRIGHCAYKHPYAKISYSDDESIFKSKYEKKKQANKKNNLHLKEQSDNESVTNDERDEILFIVETEKIEA